MAEKYNQVTADSFDATQMRAGGIEHQTRFFERTNIHARIRKGYGPVAQSDPAMDPEEVEHRAFSSWE